MDKRLNRARAAMEACRPGIEAVYETRYTQVLEAFRAERISATHFMPTSGYGYDDLGRDKLEALYARVFGAEAALVRQQIVSGSHAIALALFGNLRPGEELLTVGLPYDTMQTVIGLHSPVAGSLREQGISCRVLDFDFLQADPAQVVAALRPETRMVALQRSRGYALRPSLSIAQIAAIIEAVHQVRTDVIVFVDNCYGEFVELQEPSHCGADLIAGSLIKNPGAGIAPGGGYVLGREEYVARAACRLTIPGAGKELGASLTSNRPFFQALLFAPQVVAEALLGVVFSAALLQEYGFMVSPLPEEPRTDIIQTIALATPERLIAFCRGIQTYSPVDSFALPEPSPMPGYDSDIIMASGSFISGSSIELSADAPLREPYVAFLQGGLSRYHAIYAVQHTLADMEKQGLI